MMTAGVRRSGARPWTCLFSIRFSFASLLLLVVSTWRPAVHDVAALVVASASTTRTTPPDDGSVRPNPKRAPRLFVGLDLGTSGARISVVDDSTHEVYASSLPWTHHKYDDPAVWWRTVTDLLQGASAETNLKENCASICISGTSASCLLVDRRSLKVLRKPRMYNYHVIQSSDAPASGVQAMDGLRDGSVPPRHTVMSPTSTLAKLLAWQAQSAIDVATTKLVHQADYVSIRAMRVTPSCGRASNLAAEQAWSSDFHNCLKLGYDVQAEAWPLWMKPLLRSTGLDMEILPNQVVSPGVPVGTIAPSIAQLWGVSDRAVICGGTTDSNAAFVAATGLRPTVGTAVTSLGSTLALKQLSTTYVEDADLGVYSHAVPTPLIARSIGNQQGDNASLTNKLWLVGGASNVGCAILRKEGFSNEELTELTEAIDPTRDSPYEYYPLSAVGERFPVADASKAPVLDPKPESRSEYLKGLLQGIAQVEVDGYLALKQLGACPPLVQVWTSGGGSRNDKWTLMRERMLNDALPIAHRLQVRGAEHSEASYGAALLAASTWITNN